ncbi:MAG: sel1 repeat family protein, partial [Bacteroidaceae bacterium]|nr:sel1 repeat family protein [Bacteroidaceae bacterium]
MKRNFLVLMVLALSVPVLAQTWSKELEKAAKKGDVTAQLAVGNAYFNGDGVNADKEKAAQWYNMAALANSAEGKAKLY